MNKSDFRKVLEPKTVQDLVGTKRDILILSPEQTIKDAFAELRTARVRSAPVKTNDSWQLVDYFDFVWYLVDTLNGISDSSGTSVKDLLQVPDVIDSFLKTPLSKVANYSKRNEYVSAKLSTSVKEVADGLSKGAKKALVIEDDQVTNVLSGTDIIGLLRKQLNPEAESQSSTTIESLGLGTQKAVTVDEETPVIQAFCIMREKGYSALPILTEEGDVVSVVSIRDLQFCEQQNNFSLLNEPVFDYIKQSRQLSVSSKTMYPYIWCKKDSSVEMVIKRLAATQVHRLVVVDEGRRPTGVVSVVDVIGALMKQ
eukprot:gb/GECH01013316.1/.p1 GENE.gb/GECH01013316.1/~~gb/GECH01013316.1/.p1  ORF type:complete len:312 (+),score=78.77 gb/GECH01013316.1/:1-936(+)